MLHEQSEQLGREEESAGASITHMEEEKKLLDESDRRDETEHGEFLQRVSAERDEVDTLKRSRDELREGQAAEKEKLKTTLLGHKDLVSKAKDALAKAEEKSLLTEREINDEKTRWEQVQLDNTAKLETMRRSVEEAEQGFQTVQAEIKSNVTTWEAEVKQGITDIETAQSIMVEEAQTKVSQLLNGEKNIASLKHRWWMHIVRSVTGIYHYI